MIASSPARSAAGSRYRATRQGLRLSETALGLWLTLAVCCASVAAADKAPVALARYVPADVGLCVEAEGLHQRLEEFLAGPLYGRWREYPPFAVWHAQQQVQFAKFNSVLKAKLGISLNALRSELFGREWLLAVYPPQSDEQFAGRDVPDGFLLVRAADPALLKQAAEKLIATERDDKRYLGSSTADFAGRSFTIHELEDESKHRIYLAYDGDLGCMATDREKLRQVLALQAQAADDAAPTLAALPQYVAARKQLSPDAVLRAFVHAQAWEPYYEALARRAKEGEREESVKFRRIWTHLDSLAAGVELGATTRVEAHVAWNEKGMSPELRNLLASAGRRHSSAVAVPGDCLAALSLQIDVKEIADILLAIARRDADDKGRRIPTEAVLAARLAAGLGPGLTAYVAPAEALKLEKERRKSGGAKAGAAEESVKSTGIDAWPVDWVVGLDTQALQPGEPTMADVLEPLIRVGLSLAADAYNAEHKATAKVESLKIGELQVTGLTGLGPLGGAGVFVARHVNRLWCGGTPGSLAHASQLKPEDSLEHNGLYRQVHNPRRENADQFVFVNLREIRRTVEAVVAQPPVWLAVLQTPGAQSGVRELQSLLTLADAALLEGAISADGAGVSLAVGVAEGK